MLSMIGATSEIWNWTSDTIWIPTALVESWRQIQSEPAFVAPGSSAPGVDGREVRCVSVNFLTWLQSSPQNCWHLFNSQVWWPVGMPPPRCPFYLKLCPALVRALPHAALAGAISQGWHQQQDACLFSSAQTNDASLPKSCWDIGCSCMAGMTRTNVSKMIIITVGTTRAYSILWPARLSTNSVDHNEKIY